MMEEFSSMVKTSELVGRYMALHDFLVVKQLNNAKLKYVEIVEIASILGYTDLIEGMEED